MTGCPTCFEARMALMDAATRAGNARDRHDDDAYAFWLAEADKHRAGLRACFESHREAS